MLFECKKTILIPLIGIGILAAYINGRVGVGANNLGKNPLLFWIAALSLSYACILAA